MITNSHIHDAQNFAIFNSFRNNNYLVPPRYISDLCNQRKLLRRHFLNSRDAKLKTLINRLSNTGKNRLRNEKNKTWNNFLKNIARDSNFLWFKKLKHNKNYIPIPPHSEDDTTAYTGWKNAEVIPVLMQNNFLKNLHSLAKIRSTTSVQMHADSWPHRIDSSPKLFKPLTFITSSKNIKNT